MASLWYSLWVVDEEDAYMGGEAAMMDEIDMSFPGLLLVLLLLLLLDVESMRLLLTVDVTEDCIVRCGRVT